MPGKYGLTAFNDLIKDKVVANCPNKQLETVISNFLKEPILAWIQDSPNEFKIYLAGAKDGYAKFLNGCSLKVFRQNLATQAIKILLEGTLATISEKAERVELVISTQDIFQDVEKAELYSPLFVAPGKTHGISRLDQLVWKSEEHVYKTMFYCFIDVYLTLHLEVCLKSCMQVYSSSVLMLPPFTEMDMRHKSGQKIQFLIADLFSKANMFQTKIKTPCQVAFLTKALEVEGFLRERASDYTKDDTALANYPIIQLPSASTLREIMTMDSHCNIQEFQLGLTHLYDASNFEETKSRLSKCCDLF